MESLGCAISNLEHTTCTFCKGVEDAEARVLEAQEHLINVKIARNASHDRLVRKLPPEIVSRIFETYVDMHFQIIDSPFFKYSMEGAPLRLGAVCHTWRTTAWAAPQLWTRMAVNVCLKGRKTIPELAKQWLERTGKLPLSICLYQDLYGDNKKTRTVDNISLIHTICTFSYRWETLDILINDELIQDDIISQYWSPNVDGGVCSLRHLRLERLSPVFTKQLFRNFRSRPSPTYVTLNWIDLDHLDIDWSNVITFKAEFLTPQRSFKVFREAPYLRKLILRAVCSEQTATPPTSVIIPTLLSLGLSFQRDSQPAMFLNSLTFQSLEEFCYGSPESSELIDSLVSFIARSHCQLKTLHLLNFCVDSDLVRLLQATTSLTCLDISLRRKNDVGCLFKSLSKTTLEYLPHLTKLRLGMEARSMVPWEGIPNIFDPSQSYTGPSTVLGDPHSLQRHFLKLQINFKEFLEDNGRIDAKSVHRISKLLEHGIVISIRCRKGRRRDLIASSFAHHYPNGEPGIKAEDGGS